MLTNYRESLWVNGLNSLMILLSIALLFIAERFEMAYQEHRHVFRALEASLVVFFAFAYLASCLTSAPMGQLRLI